MDRRRRALRTALSIFCASEGKRNITALWSPLLSLLRNGEPPPLVTMKTGTWLG